MQSITAQVYGECPTAGAKDCLDDSSDAVGCAVASVAGRVGSSYAVQLEGPESVRGTIEYTGDGLFAAEYVAPAVGEYELQVGVTVCIACGGFAWLGVAVQRSIAHPYYQYIHRKTIPA